MLVSVLVVPNSYVRVVSSFCTYLMNLGGSTFSSGKRGGVIRCACIWKHGLLGERGVIRCVCIR